MTVKLIVGLGNPGDKYLKTRHNAGFLFLDYMTNNFSLNKKFNALVSKIDISNKQVILLKPMTFMNLSGDAVQKALHFYKIKANEMLVAHDELDFNAGVIKLKVGGGHAGHNGLRDIITKTGSRDFIRLRIGINRPPHSGQVSSYVLKPPSKVDKQAINESFISGQLAVEKLLKEDLESAMLFLHS